ncbi:DUF937 domain-containing protein [Arsenicicoccus sp. oral taxon 190]|uniref:DUF937 domain-containing protein n=1 Tax=Arsenicicoccus sp. oral taxon 190 TaxID=1658671 RepID=UPI00067A13DD|nr:DUF937 domain-containing protein [Arsenicicoccus sp. oral taxon 190]AKT52323.1 hypothetical protein ADJ73_15445 [Arsenicicoccus sp. oral taxon 190]
MSAVDEILQSLPVGQIAQELGARPEEVQRAAAAALPALLGGLQANATDPDGARSLTEALGQHDPGLVDGGVDLAQVDTRDGEAIAAHIFGDNQGQVAQQLGGLQGVGGPLVQRLIPILAPIVMSWLAKQVLGQAGAGGSLGQAQGGGVGGSILSDALGSVLGRATGQAGMGSDQSVDRREAQGFDTGTIIRDVLGGLLGGGRR